MKRRFILNYKNKRMNSIWKIKKIIIQWLDLLYIHTANWVDSTRVDLFIGWHYLKSGWTKYWNNLNLGNFGSIAKKKKKCMSFENRLSECWIDLLFFEKCLVINRYSVKWLMRIGNFFFPHTIHCRCIVSFGCGFNILVYCFD